MLEEGSGNLTFRQVLDGLAGLIERYSAIFTDISASYRLTAADSGITRSFALKGGTYLPLGESEPVDVTITGKEQHLLAVFNKKLNPAGALLTGKIKVKGSLAALNALAAYL